MSFLFLILHKNIKLLPTELTCFEKDRTRSQNKTLKILVKIGAFSDFKQFQIHKHFPFQYLAIN